MLQMPGSFQTNRPFGSSYRFGCSIHPKKTACESKKVKPLGP